MALTTFWTLVFFLVTAPGARATSRGPDCEKAGLSAWAAEWIANDDLVSALPGIGSLRTLWLRQLEFDPGQKLFLYKEHPVFTRLRAAASRKTCLGAFIHNSGPAGFDPTLGQAILKLPDPALQKLAKLSVQKGWRALQVDIESLPESAADDYEAFLDRLLRALKPHRIRLSIALHARASAQQPYELARFQRWDRLAKKDVDFVVMAYDQHWETSPPGPVASWAWVRSIAEYAASVLPPGRVLIGLPNYGYLWRRDAAKNGWRGRAMLSTELARLVSAEKGWTRLPGDVLDGESYRNAAGDEIAFDGAPSLEAKARRLAHEPSALRRIAMWRIGGGLPKLDPINGR